LAAPPQQPSARRRCFAGPLLLVFLGIGGARVSRLVALQACQP
jgi:hypothetical protein